MMCLNLLSGIVSTRWKSLDSFHKSRSVFIIAPWTTTFPIPNSRLMVALLFPPLQGCSYLSPLAGTGLDHVPIKRIIHGSVQDLWHLIKCSSLMLVITVFQYQLCWVLLKALPHFPFSIILCKDTILVSQMKTLELRGHTASKQPELKLCVEIYYL